MDRDFVLLFDSPDAGRSAAITGRDGGGYAVVASFNPRFGGLRDSAARSIKIVIDCSGSMEGDSIAQARSALMRIVNSIRPQDYVNIICFGSQTRALFKRQRLATDRTLARVRSLAHRLNATMGGTELGRALDLAYGMEMPDGPTPNIFLITDGEVWSRGSILRRAARSGHRIFTVGVGAAPVEDTVRPLAERTGGACEMAAPNEELADKIHRHFLRMYAPEAQARVEWPSRPIQVEESEAGCVYSGDTLHVYARYAYEPGGEVKLTLSFRDGTTQTVRVPVVSASSERAASIESGRTVLTTEHSTIARITAAARMRTLDRPDKIMDIATTYQLMSEWTSCIVVDVREDADKMRDMPALRKVAQTMAAGWHGLGTVHARVRLGVPAGFQHVLCLDSSAGVLRAGVHMSENLDDLKQQQVSDDHFGFERMLGGQSARFWTLQMLDQFGLQKSVIGRLRELVDAGADERIVVALFVWSCGGINHFVWLGDMAKVELNGCAEPPELNAEVTERIRKLSATVVLHRKRSRSPVGTLPA
jgi:Ca-activated chloride channel family protein